MKVVRAGIVGFCMGVRRAVDIARQESGGGGRVYTLGPLIHNPVVLKSLEERGITVMEEGGKPANMENTTVIIRAHGVSPEMESDLARRGARLLDATCPHVKSSQNRARKLSGEGFHIFLAGEGEHGEIAGIRGYVDGPCCVVADPLGAEAAAANLAQEKPSAKTALIGQTTISQEEYRVIGEVIKRYFPDLEIVNTICGATRERQNALRELAGKVDAFVIAGGRESANTRRLLSIAQGSGKRAWLVETPDDLPPEIASFGTVGLAAGASTPDSLIEEIEEALNCLSAELYQR